MNDYINDYFKTWTPPKPLGYKPYPHSWYTTTPYPTAAERQRNARKTLANRITDLLDAQRSVLDDNTRENLAMAAESLRT